MFLKRFNSYTVTGFTVSLFVMLLTMTCGSNGTDNQVIYSVNFSTTSTNTEVEEVDTNIETALGRSVYFDKITSISYDLYMQAGGITDNEATTIEDELNAHPHVCEYCRYGNGCPTVVLSKAACP